MFLTEEMQSEEAVNVLIESSFTHEIKKIDQSSELTKAVLISKVEPNSYKYFYHKNRKHV